MKLNDQPEPAPIGQQFAAETPPAITTEAWLFHSGKWEKVNTCFSNDVPVEVLRRRLEGVLKRRKMAVPILYITRDWA